jgi:RNA polymerase sigma-70 factor (ECF subfamily)
MVDEACQEVFVECFRQGGVLDRAQTDQPGGFRAYLYGVARNVALRFEQRMARSQARREQDPQPLDEREADETSLSHVFDREWARAIVRQAIDLLSRNAQAAGPEAQRRFEILRLRFTDGVPIRDIAQRWDADATKLHTEYARARRELKAALFEVVAGYHPGSRDVVEHECQKLRDLVG